MNFKKGFTLVELLAVIIILGVIVLIAIPRVNNVIRGSRDAAFVQNNNNIIRAADNFMNANRNMFNIEVGESIEISFEELQAADFLGIVENPHGSNQCSGYIIFTRTVSGTFSIMPITDCINDNINSSEDLGLVLYYDFNNPSEPTENFIREPIINDSIGNKVIPTGWILSDPNHDFGTIDYGTSSDGRHGAKSIYTLVESNEWQNRWDINWDINNFDADMEYTFSIYGKVPSLDDNPGLSLNFQGTDSGGERVDFTRVVYFTQSNEWERLSLTTRPSDFGAVSYVGFMEIYPRASTYDPPVEFKMSAPQMEQKSYRTPFVVGSRDGTVKNAAKDNYHTTLLLDTTPRWVNDSINGTGSYYFNGENTIIDMRNMGLDSESTYTDGATVSMWIKPSSHSNPLARYMAGFHYWSINDSGNLQNMVRLDGVNYWLYGNSVIPIDEWTHVTYKLIPGESVSYYVNGELDAIYESEDLVLNSYSANSAVGASYNSHYEGNIDEVKIFERALTSEEVKQLYLSSLR